MNQSFQRFMAVCLVFFTSFSMLVPIHAQTSTLPGHWASVEMDKWLEMGLIRGYPDHALAPDKAISRAEFISILDNLFHYGDAPDGNFTDVPKSAWYYKVFSRAAAEGIIVGNGGQMRPEAPISRQEAALVVYRAFALKQTEAVSGTVNFSDSKDMAPWSREAVQALAQNRMMTGRPDGSFYPAAPITRAESIKLLDNIVSEMKNKAGTYTGTVERGLVVNTGSVTLKDMTIKGDLYLAQGIGDGTVTLENTKVMGRTIVRGGGEHSIYINNSSLSGTLVILKKGGKVRIVAQGTTAISGTQLYSGARLETENKTGTEAGSGFGAVVAVSLPTGESLLLDGDFEEVDITTTEVRIQLTDGSIGRLQVGSAAGGSTVEMAQNTQIRNLIADAGVTVKGKGSIQTADIRVNGVVLEPIPEHLNTAVGVTVAFAGKTGETNTVSSSNNLPDSGIEETGGSELAFGDDSSEQSSNLTVTGNSGVTTVETEVGELKKTYPVRYLEGKDSEISFDMADVTPNQPLTLEVEEIHNRSSQVLAYTVLVNGVEQYFRTYEEASAGPNHYFVSVNPSVVGNRTTARVTFRNNGGSTVNFGRVWAYSDFQNLLTNEHVYRPMTVGLFQPSLNWKDYQADLALVNGLKAAYSNHGMYQPGLGFDILYMKWSEEETRDRIDYLMRLSRDTGLQIQLSINSWWGGTPEGPDGKGGYWKDILYNQVVYDPLNIDGKGYYKLSTPNIWGNTPWLSMNNDYYNSIRAEKISKVTAYISQKTAELQADGVEIPPVSVFTENEPMYWPYYSFNASPDGAADFSPLVIAAALEDGVTLDPADGLSEEERLWLFKNMNNYVSTAGKAMADGFGANAVVVDNGIVSYPGEQLVENAYSHMFVVAKYPNYDEKRALWETNLLDSIRYGAEWENGSEGHYLDYIAARGKFAYVNTERSMLTDFSYLSEAYAKGADYDTIYNYREGDQNFLLQADGKENDAYSTPIYENSIYSYEFRGQNTLVLNEQLVQAEGVRREPLGGDYVICPDNGNATGGKLTFKVDNQGKPLSTGLAVELEGRCLSSMSDNCRIEIWAGSSQDNLTLVKTLKEFSTEKINVSSNIDKSQSTAFIQVRLFSTGLSSALYSWSAIRKVRVMTPWDKAGGHTNGFEYSRKQMREHSLWVSYRADVERMLADYREKAGEDARYLEILEQVKDCRYATAYKLLSGALSELLPAKYIVRGSGTLGKYPIGMTIDDPDVNVLTTLMEYGNTVKIGFASELATDVNVVLKQWNSPYYLVEEKDGGVYEIKPAQAGDTGAAAASGGMAVFSISLTGAASRQYPQSFEARYALRNNDLSNGAPEGTIDIQSQDPVIGEYADHIRLKLAEAVDIRRGAEGTPDGQLQAVPLEMLADGDLLRLTLNGSQEVTAIKAYYGKISGTVDSVQPISITGSLQNAFLRITDAGGEVHRFEIGSECKLDSPKATGTNILTARADSLGFQAGDQVTVYYSPYTVSGREKRALKISEPYDTLVSETFEGTTEAAWRSRVYRAVNVQVVPLDTNVKDKVLRPADLASPGELVWQLQSASPFTTLAVEYSGRSIINDSSSVKWYVSPDDSTWTEVGGIQANTADDGNYTLRRGFTLNSQVNGLTTVYLKCVIRSGYDTWGSLNDVTIKSRASVRELDSATLTPGTTEVYEGNTAPMDLHALYNTGDPVQLQNVRVAYVISNDGILKSENGLMTAVKQGSTQVKAFLSDGGKVVQTNSVTVTVKPNILNSIQASLTSGNIAVGGTTSVTAIAYNTDGVEINSQDCGVSYRSDDENIVSVSSDGTVTGLNMGTAIITVNVSYCGVTVGQDVTVMVTGRKRIILRDDFEGYPIGAVGNAGVLGAYAASNLQIEKMDPPGYTQKGLTGLFDGVDTGWQGKLDGYVIYKLDSSDPAGFRKLILTLKGRAVSVPAVGANGEVSFSAGEDPSNLAPVGQIPQNGDVNAVYTVNLTGIAEGKNCIYFRIDLKAGRFTWAFLDSIQAEEEVSVPSYFFRASTGLDQQLITIGHTAQASVTGWNDDGTPVDLAGAVITYTSDNEDIAEVDQHGIVTGKAAGTVNIGATVAKDGKTISAGKVGIAVSDSVTLAAEDFEDGDYTGDGKAVQHSDNIVVGPLDPSTPNQCMYAASGTGYVLYQLESANPDGFQSLFLEYRGRSIGGSSVVIYAGGTADQLVELDRESVPDFTIQQCLTTPKRIDLSSAANGKTTIYIKIEFNTNYESWACVTDWKAIEYFTNL